LPPAAPSDSRGFLDKSKVAARVTYGGIFTVVAGTLGILGYFGVQPHSDEFSIGISTDRSTMPGNAPAALSYYFVKKVEELAAVPSSTQISTVEFQRWARSNQGVPAKESEGVQVVVATSSHSPIVLTKLVPRVVSRRSAPVTGAEVSACEFCGGDVSVRHALIDLAAQTPTVRLSSGGERIDFPLYVSGESPEVFYMSAWATGKVWDESGERITGSPCDCEWVADLYYTRDGHSEVRTIDDNGRPFRVVGTTPQVSNAFIKNGKLHKR
jgi:hypothetical protein